MQSLLKSWPLALLLAFLFLAKSPPAAAQDWPDTMLLVVKMLDGQKLTGRIERKTRDTLFFVNEEIGKVAIPRDKVGIVTRYDLRASSRGDYWKDSPLEAINFMAPSGHGLKEGDGYVRTLFATRWEAAFGLSDRVSIGAGLRFGESRNTPIFSIKYNTPYRTGRVQAAIGATATRSGFLLDEAQRDGLDQWAFYGLNTFGPRDNQLTVGAGYLFAKNAVPRHGFFYSMGYQKRRSPQFCFMVEAHLVRQGSQFSIPMGGGMRVFRKNFVWDYGVTVLARRSDRPRPTFTTSTETTNRFFPWVALNVPIRAKKGKSRQSAH